MRRRSVVQSSGVAAPPGGTLWRCSGPGERGIACMIVQLAWGVRRRLQAVDRAADDHGRDRRRPHDREAGDAAARPRSRSVRRAGRRGPRTGGSTTRPRSRRPPSTLRGPGSRRAQGHAAQPLDEDRQVQRPFERRTAPRRPRRRRRRATPTPGRSPRVARRTTGRGRTARRAPTPSTETDQPHRERPERRRPVAVDGVLRRQGEDHHRRRRRDAHRRAEPGATRRWPGPTGSARADRSR